MTRSRKPPVHALQSPLKAVDRVPFLALGLTVGWVLLLGWVAFLWNLGHLSLVDETEPLFAEAARQMVATGDWLTPYFNGETRFDKPPLIYWLMAIAYQTFGVNEFAARLPSALAAIAIIALGFHTLRRFGFSSPLQATHAPIPEDAPTEGRRGSMTALALGLSAWIGAAAIALNVQTIAWARTGVSDMLLTGCMASALLAFFLGYAQPQHPRRQTAWYLAFYGLAALAVLTKGPVGIVMPGLIIGAFGLYLGNLGQLLREMRLIPGIVLFLTLTLPWYVLIIREHGQTYIETFFGYHNVERFTQVVNNHSAPWYFYFLVVLVGFLPWSPFLPVAIARLRLWNRRAWQAQPRSAHLGLFAGIWFAVVFIFFTVAVTKLPSYTIPLLPAAGMVVALYWSDQMLRPQDRRSTQISAAFNVGLLLLLAAATAYAAQWLGGDPAMPDLADQVRQSGLLTLGSLLWGVTALVALALLLQQRVAWTWLVNGIGFVAVFVAVLMPLLVLADGQRQQPLRHLSETIVEVQAPQEEVIMVGFKKPSVVFYTQRPVTYIYSPNEAIAHLRLQIADIPPAERGTAMVLGQADVLQEAPLKPRQYEVVDEAGPYRLIRINLRRLRRKHQ